MYHHLAFYLLGVDSSLSSLLGVQPCDLCVLAEDIAERGQGQTGLEQGGESSLLRDLEVALE